MKRVCILYLGITGGHRKCAEYLQEALKTKGIEVYLFEVFKNKFLSSLIRFFYYFLLKTKEIYKFFYYKTQKIPLTKFIARVLLSFEMKKIKKIKPDFLIVTNAFLSHMPKIKNTKLIAFLTDALVNGYWISSMVDFYCVSTEEAKRELVEKYKIPHYKVKLMPFPIKDEFFEKKEKKKKVVISGGFWGVFEIKQIIEILKKMNFYDVLLLCGKNKKIKKLKDEGIKFLDFSDRVWEVLCDASVFVTKPGYLSILEGLASGCHVFLTRAFSICEENNKKFFLNYALAKEIDLCLKKLDSSLSCWEINKKQGLLMKASEFAELFMNAF